MTIAWAATDLLALLAAIVAAALGGSAFVEGVVGVAAWLRLPRALVATTLAAFATSSPELAVSTLAALSGQPEIGLGDALGSNIVNVGLLLGTALLFGAMPARLSDIRRDMVMAVAAPLFTLVLALDGRLSRADGLLLLAMFGLWLAAIARQASAHRRQPAADGLPPVRPLRAWLQLVVGLALLVAAGRLFVSGASGIAAGLGVHPYVIGATVVAAGTSLPELVTVLLSRLRGHDDVGLGTLLGSNLFNGLAVVGIAASLHPIRVPPGEIAVTLAFGVLTVLLIVPRASRLSPRRGIALLSAYAAFIAMTLARLP